MGKCVTYKGIQCKLLESEPPYPGRGYKFSHLMIFSKLSKKGLVVWGILQKLQKKYLRKNMTVLFVLVNSPISELIKK